MTTASEVVGPFEYRFEASPKAVRLARQVLALWLREQPVAPDRVHDLLVACSELCANAMRHGQCERVMLGAKVEGDGVALEVHDDGRGFTLSAQAGMPDLDAESGRGLHIVEMLTDHLEVRCEEGATVVKVYKGDLLDLRESEESQRDVVGEQPATSAQP